MLAAAQMIERPALGRRHQPRAGLFRHARRGPVFERRQQRFLRQVLGQRHVAQHPRQARDQPRLLDAPDGEDGAMDVGGRHRRRLDLSNRLHQACARTSTSQAPSTPGVAKQRTSQVPSQPGI